MPARKTQIVGRNVGPLPNKLVPYFTRVKTINAKNLLATY